MAGRPKKPVSDARGNVLRIRLSDEERKELDEAAESNTLDTSTWARSELIRLARQLAERDRRK